MNIEKLKAAMKKRGISEEELAKKTGIGLFTLQKKLNGEVEVVCSEIKKIAEALNFLGEDIMTIFFDK